MPVRARLHGPRGARRARRDAPLRPGAGRRRDLRAAARSTPGWCPSAPTPSWPRVAGAVSDVAHVEVFEAASATRSDSRRARATAARLRPRRPSKETGRQGTPRARRRSASTPSGSTSSCTSWASSCCTAPQVEALAAHADVPGLSQAMQNLTRTSHALQAMVMQVRMIPVEAVFLRFPRLVRDLSTKLGKQVELRPGRQGHRARPHGRRRARRPARAPDPQRARPRPRGPGGARRGRQARHRHAAPVRPPRRRQRGHRGRATTAAASTRRKWRAGPPSEGWSRPDAVETTDMAQGHRAAVPPGLLHRRGHQRHLRPRRRHGRRAQHDPRARRRGRS